MEKNHTLRTLLQETLSFAFFTKVAQTFLQRLSPEELSAVEKREQAEIALICELTSRLNAIDCHPMNRVLGFGAKYLQDYFSPWVVQHGGYVSALQPGISQAYTYFALLVLFNII